VRERRRGRREPFGVRAELRDGILQIGSQRFDRAVLLQRDLSEGSSVARRRFEVYRLIEDVRRGAVRARDVGDAHPGADDLVPVAAPVDRAADGAHGEEAGERRRQQERHKDYPTPPASLFIERSSILLFDSAQNKASHPPNDCR
jgi:hypothetical protein